MSLSAPPTIDPPGARARPRPVSQLDRDTDCSADSAECTFSVGSDGRCGDGSRVFGGRYGAYGALSFSGGISSGF